MSELVSLDLGLGLAELGYFWRGKVKKLPYLGIKFGAVSELSSLKHELGLAELGF